MLDPTKKDTSCPGAKKPQKNGRRGEITFRIKPHACQRCLEGSTTRYAHQKPEAPQRLSQTCLWVSRSFWWRYGLVVACCRVRAARELLKEVTIIFITSTRVWPQLKQQGGNSVPSTENWIKDLLSMAPPIRTRSSFPFNHSLPLGSFHKPLILLHQRADRLKTTITEN